MFKASNQSYNVFNYNSPRFSYAASDELVVCAFNESYNAHNCDLHLSFQPRYF